MSSITELQIGYNPLESIPSDIYQREQSPFPATLRYMRQVRSDRLKSPTSCKRGLRKSLTRRKSPARHAAVTCGTCVRGHHVCMRGR